MKKKIINGILMVAMLFATTSAFVSCKDNDADVSTELKGQNAELQKQIAELKTTINGLQTELANVKSSIPAAYDDAALKARVTELENLLATLSAKVDAIGDNTIANLQSQTAALQAQLTSLAAEAETLQLALASLATVLDEIIYSITPEGTMNPVFGMLALPTDSKSQVLASYVGEYEEAVAFHGTRIAAGQKISDTAGKLFFTLNPNWAEPNLGGFSLVNSQDKAAPAELTVAPSTELLKWGWSTRAEGSNGLYEAAVKITNLDAVALDYSKILDDKSLNNGSINDFVINLYSALMSSAHERLALKYQTSIKSADGEEKLSPVRTGYDIALFSVKPLSYDYEIELTDEGLQKLNNRIYNMTVTTSENKSTKDQIIEFVDACIKKGITSLNTALQPILLVKQNNVIQGPYKTVKAGTISLLPTSSTAEIFAPALKKFVKVDCDGKEVANTGVIDGTVQEVNLTVQAGKTYTVTYDAIDYFGVQRSKEYTITVE